MPGLSSESLPLPKAPRYLLLLCPTINTEITPWDTKLWNKTKQRFFLPMIHQYLIRAHHIFFRIIMVLMEFVMLPLEECDANATWLTPRSLPGSLGVAPCGRSCCYFKQTVMGCIHFAWDHFSLTTIPRLLTGTSSWGYTVANGKVLDKKDPCDNSSWLCFTIAACFNGNGRSFNQKLLHRRGNAHGFLYHNSLSYSTVRDLNTAKPLKWILL